MERMNKFQGVNVYVKNLDEGVTEDAMREAFAQYGTITRYVLLQQCTRPFGLVAHVGSPVSLARDAKLWRSFFSFFFFFVD